MRAWNQAESPRREDAGAPLRRPGRRPAAVGGPAQVADDLLRGVAVPVLLDDRPAARPFPLGVDRRAAVEVIEPVPARGHRLRPLGLAPQGQAGGPGEVRLLLQPARVGDEQGATAEQPEHGRVAHRSDEVKTRAPRKSGALDGGPRPRVDREEDGPGEFLQARPDAREQSGLVGHLRAVQGRQDERPLDLGQRGQLRTGLESGEEAHRVVGHVAQRAPPFQQPFAPEVLPRRARGVVQAVGEVVRADPVDLLGHPPIVAAQSGLDVRERPAQLGRRERAGQGGVRVADDDDPVRSAVLQGRLDPREDARRLLAVARRADLQVDVRGPEPELLEEDVGEAGVVVLAGMDGDLPAPLPRRARLTGAILMNCGRAPTTVAIFTRGSPSGGRLPPGSPPGVGPAGNGRSAPPRPAAAEAAPLRGTR